MLQQHDLVFGGIAVAALAFAVWRGLRGTPEPRAVPDIRAEPVGMNLTVLPTKVTLPAYPEPEPEPTPAPAPKPRRPRAPVAKKTPKVAKKVAKVAKVAKKATAPKERRRRGKEALDG
jgi:outer membrane biosynthesis protein TonB